MVHAQVCWCVYMLFVALCVYLCVPCTNVNRKETTKCSTEAKHGLAIAHTQNEYQFKSILPLYAKYSKIRMDKRGICCWIPSGCKKKRKETAPVRVIAGILQLAIANPIYIYMLVEYVHRVVFIYCWRSCRNIFIFKHTFTSFSYVSQDKIVNFYLFSFYFFFIHFP